MKYFTSFIFTILINTLIYAQSCLTFSTIQNEDSEEIIKSINKICIDSDNEIVSVNNEIFKIFDYLNTSEIKSVLTKDKNENEYFFSIHQELDMITKYNKQTQKFTIYQVTIK